MAELSSICAIGIAAIDPTFWTPSSACSEFLHRCRVPDRLLSRFAFRREQYSIELIGAAKLA